MFCVDFTNAMLDKDAIEGMCRGLRCSLCILVLRGSSSNTLSMGGLKQWRPWILEMMMTQEKPNLKYPAQRPLAQHGVNAVVKSTLALFSIICSRKALKLI